MEIERVQPPTSANEFETLSAWLEFERATLERKCRDLDGAGLRARSVQPSDLSLLGLVRHMARIERSYFRITFAGESVPALFQEADQPSTAFSGADSADADESFSIWHEECDHARRILAQADSLDQCSVNERRAGGRVSLRWLLVFLIQEYARHNGHADLLRESIDGQTGT